MQRHRGKATDAEAKHQNVHSFLRSGMLGIFSAFLMGTAGGGGVREVACKMISTASFFWFPARGQ